MTAHPTPHRRTLPESGMTVGDWNRDTRGLTFTWWMPDEGDSLCSCHMGRGSLVATDMRWVLRVWATNELCVIPNGYRTSKTTVATWPRTCMPGDDDILARLDRWVVDESCGQPLVLVPRDDNPDEQGQKRETRQRRTQ